MSDIWMVKEFFLAARTRDGRRNRRKARDRDASLRHWHLVIGK